MHASDSATTRASGEFYVTGGTLPVDTGSYVPRAADNELYESLLARKFCYILTSRQVGKSSLMVRTAARLREAGVAVGVADLTAIGRNLTPEQWYAGLLARIGQQLDVEDELEDFWTDHRSVGPLLRWVEAMRSVVLVRRSAPVVIFIDEIDVVQSLGFSTDEFFAAIRECHNRRAEEPEMNRLTFCLIGVATPTDLIEDRRLTPFNIGSRIELTDLAEEDAAPLSAGMGGGGETGRRLLRRVFHWTNGHPYLTQKLCAAVAADASATSAADVDRVCEDLFLADRARDVDDNLVYVRERMLRSEVDRATLLDAYGKVHAGKQVRFDDGDRVITVLLLSGIAANGNGQLHPRNRVYERAFDRTWIRENMPDAELRRQRAAVRRGMFRVAGIAVAVVVVVGGLAVFARYQTTVARAAKEETTRLLAESQAETGRVMLRDGDLKGLLHLAQARATADEMPALASELAEEWTLWHWQLDGRLVQVFGQDSEVTAMGFSPDGSLFITGSADGIAQLWRTDTGEPHGAPLVHGSRIGHDPRWWHMSPTYTLVCFNRDSTLVALGGEDGTITVWDTATTEEHLASFRPGDGPVNQMTFDPDGFLVAYVDMPDRGKALWRWDMRDGSASLSGAPVADPERTLMQGILLPDSSALFAMSYNGLGLVDTQTGDEAWRTDHYGWLSSATWSRTRIATAYTLSVTPTGVGAPSGSVQVFDWHGTPIYELAPSRETGRVQVDATPDGRSLLTVTEKGLRLWDFATGTPYGDPIAHDGWVMYRAFNADSTLLAGASGSTVYVWDLDTGDLVVDPIRYPHPVKGLIFHPADPHVLAVQSVDRSARLWDVGPPSDYVTLATFEGEAQADHFTKGMAAFSPTQPLVAVLNNYGGEVVVWDVDARAPRYGPLTHETPVEAAAFSPDGRTLAVAATQGGIHMWDADAGVAVGTPRGGYTTSVVFTLDGSVLASTEGGGDVTVWDSRMENSVTHAVGVTFFANPGALDFDQTGHRILVGNHVGTVRIHSTSDMEVIGRPMRLDGRTSCVRFSPDDSLIITPSSDGSAQIWDARTQRAVGEPLTHRRGLRWANFSADGRYIATASDDWTAQLWDATTRQPITAPLRHTSTVLCVEFSPDGRHVATVSSQDARLWELPTPPATADEIRRKTAVATGSRLTGDGRVESLPWQEWQALRRAIATEYPAP